MARTTGRPALVLTVEEEQKLKQLAASRTAPRREVERANILLSFAKGKPIAGIQRELGASRPTIYKCVDKALAAGVQTGLKDKFHRPRQPEITPQASSWVVSLACSKPKDHGMAAELWTLSMLTDYIKKHTEHEGHPCLARIVKSTVWQILNANEIKPHKIRYYLEKRDEQFDEKMREVLMVYQEVALVLANMEKDTTSPVYTISIDEKPGVQALATTAPDLPPVPGKHATVGRDHEYVRHGTVSILAGLDLHTGQVIAQVHDRHRSSEFIELLKDIDGHYPQEAVIRVILDNHSAHISKETMRYLATRPGRFVYVHTPKHGSWLNMIEMVFSKMARTFLRHIRVGSKDELKERIMRGIAEMNAQPVIFRWKNFDLLGNATAQL